MGAFAAVCPHDFAGGARIVAIGLVIGSRVASPHLLAAGSADEESGKWVNLLASARFGSFFHLGAQLIHAFLHSLPEVAGDDAFMLRFIPLIAGGDIAGVEGIS